MKTTSFLTALGTIATLTFNTFAQQPISLQASSVNPTCNNTSDGAITINISGGTAPYTVDGSPIFGNQFIANDLFAGFYTFNIQDANNLNATADLTLTAPQTLSFQALVINPSAAGVYDGRINLTVDVPVVFNWSTTNGGNIVPGQEDQITLTQGSYNVEVVEMNGCTTSKRFDLVVAGSANPVPGMFFTSSYNPITTTIAGNPNSLPSAMTVFPNPSNGHINLKSNVDTREAVIVNDMGNVVHTSVATENGTVQGLDLKPGTYTLLTKDTAGNQTSERIVIR